MKTLPKHIQLVMDAQIEQIEGLITERDHLEWLVKAGNKHLSTQMDIIIDLETRLSKASGQ